MTPFKNWEEPHFETVGPSVWWNTSGAATIRLTGGHHIITALGMWGPVSLSGPFRVAGEENVPNNTGYYNGSQYAGISVTSYEVIIPKGADAYYTISSQYAWTVTTVKLKDD